MHVVVSKEEGIPHESILWIASALNKDKTHCSVYGNTYTFSEFTEFMPCQPSWAGPAFPRVPSAECFCSNAGRQRKPGSHLQGEVQQQPFCLLSRERQGLQVLLQLVGQPVGPHFLQLAPPCPPTPLASWAGMCSFPCRYHVTKP